MQICQAAKDLSTEVSNPLFPQRVCLGRPDQVGNGASATEFKYNPKLVIFAWRASLDKCTVICGNVTMVRILQNTITVLVIDRDQNILQGNISSEKVCLNLAKHIFSCTIVQFYPEISLRQKQGLHSAPDSSSMKHTFFRTLISNLISSSSSWNKTTKLQKQLCTQHSNVTQNS